MDHLIERKRQKARRPARTKAVGTELTLGMEAAIKSALEAAAARKGSPLTDDERKKVRAEARRRLTVDFDAFVQGRVAAQERIKGGVLTDAELQKIRQDVSKVLTAQAQRRADYGHELARRIAKRAQDLGRDLRPEEKAELSDALGKEQEALSFVNTLNARLARAGVLDEDGNITNEAKAQRIRNELEREQASPPPVDPVQVKQRIGELQRGQAPTRISGKKKTRGRKRSGIRRTTRTPERQAELKRAGERITELERKRLRLGKQRAAISGKRIKDVKARSRLSEQIDSLDAQIERLKTAYPEAVEPVRPGTPRSRGQSERSLPIKRVNKTEGLIQRAQSEMGRIRAEKDALEREIADEIENDPNYDRTDPSTWSEELRTKSTEYGQAEEQLQKLNKAVSKLRAQIKERDPELLNPQTMASDIEEILPEYGLAERSARGLDRRVLGYEETPEGKLNVEGPAQTLGSVEVTPAMTTERKQVGTKEVLVDEEATVETPLPEVRARSFYELIPAANERINDPTVRPHYEEWQDREADYKAAHEAFLDYERDLKKKHLPNRKASQVDVLDDIFQNMWRPDPDDEGKRIQLGMRGSVGERAEWSRLRDERDRAEVARDKAREEFKTAFDPRPPLIRAEEPMYGVRPDIDTVQIGAGGRLRPYNPPHGELETGNRKLVRPKRTSKPGYSDPITGSKVLPGGDEDVDIPVLPLIGVTEDTKTGELVQQRTEVTRVPTGRQVRVTVPVYDNVESPKEATSLTRGVVNVRLRDKDGKTVADLPVEVERESVKEPWRPTAKGALAMKRAGRTRRAALRAIGRFDASGGSAHGDQLRWPRGTPWKPRGPGPGRFRPEGVFDIHIIPDVTGSVYKVIATAFDSADPLTIDAPDIPADQMVQDVYERSKGDAYGAARNVARRMVGLGRRRGKSARVFLHDYGGSVSDGVSPPGVHVADVHAGGGGKTQIGDAGEFTTPFRESTVEETLMEGFAADLFGQAKKRIRRAHSRFQMEALKRLYPDLGGQLMQERYEIERGRDEEFLLRMEGRLRQKIEAAVSDPNLSASEKAHKTRAALSMERHYFKRHLSEAAWRMARSAEMMRLKESGEPGAYWLMDHGLRSHTADCRAMEGRFWPWSVLDQINPANRHPGCGCKLLSEAEARALGLAIKRGYRGVSWRGAVGEHISEGVEDFGDGVGEALDFLGEGVIRVPIPPGKGGNEWHDTETGRFVSSVGVPGSLPKEILDQTAELFDASAAGDLGKVDNAYDRLRGAIKQHYRGSKDNSPERREREESYRTLGRIYAAARNPRGRKPDAVGPDLIEPAGETKVDDDKLLDVIRDRIAAGIVNQPNERPGGNDELVQVVDSKVDDHGNRTYVLRSRYSDYYLDEPVTDKSIDELVVDDSESAYDRAKSTDYLVHVSDGGGSFKPGFYIRELTDSAPRRSAFSNEPRKSVREDGKFEMYTHHEPMLREQLGSDGSPASKITVPDSLLTQGQPKVGEPRPLAPIEKVGIVEPWSANGGYAWLVVSADLMGSESERTRAMLKSMNKIQGMSFTQSPNGMIAEHMDRAVARDLERALPELRQQRTDAKLDDPTTFGPHRVPTPMEDSRPLDIDLSEVPGMFDEDTGELVDDSDEATRYAGVSAKQLGDAGEVLLNDVADMLKELKIVDEDADTEHLTAGGNTILDWRVNGIGAEVKTQSFRGEAGGTEVHDPGISPKRVAEKNQTAKEAGLEPVLISIRADLDNDVAYVFIRRDPKWQDEDGGGISSARIPKALIEKMFGGRILPGDRARATAGTDTGEGASETMFLGAVRLRWNPARRRNIGHVLTAKETRELVAAERSKRLDPGPGGGVDISGQRAAEREGIEAARKAKAAARKASGKGKPGPKLSAAEKEARDQAIIAAAQANLLASGKQLQVQIAKQFGISQGQVSKILQAAGVPKSIPKEERQQEHEPVEPTVYGFTRLGLSEPQAVKAVEMYGTLGKNGARASFVESLQRAIPTEEDDERRTQIKRQLVERLLDRGRV